MELLGRNHVEKFKMTKMKRDQEIEFLKREINAWNVVSDKLWNNVNHKETETSEVQKKIAKLQKRLDLLNARNKAESKKLS